MHQNMYHMQNIIILYHYLVNNNFKKNMYMRWAWDLVDVGDCTAFLKEGDRDLRLPTLHGLFFLPVPGVSVAFSGVWPLVSAAFSGVLLGAPLVSAALSGVLPGVPLVSVAFTGVSFCLSRGVPLVSAAFSGVAFFLSRGVPLVSVAFSGVFFFLSPGVPLVSVAFSGVFFFLSPGVPLVSVAFSAFGVLGTAALLASSFSVSTGLAGLGGLASLGGVTLLLLAAGSRALLADPGVLPLTRRRFTEDLRLLPGLVRAPLGVS